MRMPFRLLLDTAHSLHLTPLTHASRSVCVFPVVVSPHRRGIFFNLALRTKEG